MNEQAVASTTASDDGHAQLSSDGFAALKRRYIGYHFSSRHPKGQISTGEIRDLVWVGNDILAKIKWKGQRALDTQKLSALVGMPQPELEALAATNAPLPSEVAVASSIKMVAPIPIAPRVSSMSDVLVRQPNTNYHAYYNPNMPRPPHQQQPQHQQQQQQQPTPPPQMQMQMQPQHFHSHGKQPFSQVPGQPQAQPQSVAASAGSALSSLGAVSEDRPLNRRREFVGKKLVKRLPPDGFRIGHVLDVFRDPATKKLLASVMWEGDSAPVAQTVDSVRRLLQSTEDEKRLERWVGESPATADEFSAPPSYRPEPPKATTLEGRRHEFVGKVVVEQIQQKVMVGRVVDVFHDADGFPLTKIKWDQAEEPAVQSFEATRQLVLATLQENRLEKWVLDRQTNSISPAPQAEVPLDDDSVHSASTFSDLLAKGMSRPELAQISDESPGNVQTSDSSVDAESVTDELLKCQENRSSESDNDDLNAMATEDGCGQPQLSTAAIATAACGSCAMAGRPVFVCRVQLKHELPDHIVASDSYQTGASSSTPLARDGEVTPQRNSGPPVYSDMRRQLMFPPPPSRVTPVPPTEDAEAARTRGLNANQEGIGLKTCGACRTAGLTPYICRIRLKHQTANWDCQQTFNGRPFIQPEIQRLPETFANSDPNPTRTKYVGRRFVKIKRSGEFAMGVVVDIYPSNSQKGGRRWTVLVENEDGSRAETSMDALLRLLRATQKENRFAAMEQQRNKLADGSATLDGSFYQRRQEADDSSERSDTPVSGVNEDREGSSAATSRTTTPDLPQERQTSVSVIGQKFVKYQRAGAALIGTVVHILPREPGERKLMVEVEYNTGVRDITSMEAAKKLIKATVTERRFAQLEEAATANSDDESAMEGASVAGREEEVSQCSSETFNDLQDNRSKKRARSSTPQPEELVDLALAIEHGCVTPGPGVLTVSRSRQTKMVVDLLDDGSLAYEGEFFASLAAFVSSHDIQIDSRFGAARDDMFFDGKSLAEIKQEVDSKQRRASSSGSSNRRAVMRTNLPAKSKRSEVLDLDIFPQDVRTMLEQFPELDCSLDGYTDEVKHAKISDRLAQLEATGSGSEVLGTHRQALVDHFRKRLDAVGFEGLTHAEFQIIRLHNIESAVITAAQHREELKEKLASRGTDGILSVQESKLQSLVQTSTVSGVSAVFPHVKAATSMVDVEIRADELVRSGTQLASKRGTNEAKRLNDAARLRSECEKRLTDLGEEETQFVEAHEANENEASQLMEELQEREARLLRELEELQQTIKDQQESRQVQQQEFENRKRRYVAQRQSTERKYQRAIARHERAQTNLDALQLFTSYVAGMPTGSRLSTETLALIKDAVQHCELYAATTPSDDNFEMLRHQDTTVRLVYEAIRLIGRLASGNEYSEQLNSFLERLESRYQPSHCYTGPATSQASAVVQHLRTATTRNCTAVLFDVKTLQHQVPKRMPERVARVLKVMKRVQEFAARFQHDRSSSRETGEDNNPTGRDGEQDVASSASSSAKPDLWVHVFGNEIPSGITSVFWECVLLAHSEHYIEYLFDRTQLARDSQASQGEVFNPIKDTALFHVFGPDAELELDQSLGLEDSPGNSQPQCFINSVHAALSGLSTSKVEELRGLPPPTDSTKVLLWDRWKDEVWSASPDLAGVLDYVGIHSDLEVYHGQDQQAVSDEQLRVVLELKRFVPVSKPLPSTGNSNRKPGKKKGRRNLNGGGAPVDDVWMSLKQFVGTSVRVPEYDGSKYLYGIMVWDHATSRPAVEMTDGAVLSFYQFEFKAGRRDRNPKKKVQIDLPGHSWTTIMDVPHLTQSANMHGDWAADADALSSGSAEAKFGCGLDTPQPKRAGSSALADSPLLTSPSTPHLTSTLSVDVSAEAELVRTVTPSNASDSMHGKRALSPTRESGPKAKVARASAPPIVSASRSADEDDCTINTDGLQAKLLDTKAIVSGPGWWEELEFAGSDTFISAESLNAALAAATLACRGVNALLTGVLEEAPAEQPSLIRNVFCVTRPPGHHAGRYGNTRGCSQNGFCLLNNVAIAAFYARVWHGLRRIAVIDIDAHFGNGTAELFEGDSDAFYASVHLQYETPAAFFPSSDAVRLGEDKTSDNQVFVNVYPPRRWNNPFAPQDHRLRGRGGFRKGLVEKILPALERFQPDIVFISAGFDGFEGDPLGSGLGLKPNDYEWTAREIVQAAERICDGKVVAVLEGGYDVSNATDGLARCTEAFISGMTVAAGQPL